MARALIGLGANLGDREHALGEAVKRLSAAPHGRLLGVSRWLVTRPIGGPGGQGDFLNAAALLDTSQNPHELHATLCEIETALGRRRSQRWEARSLDLDLLLYDDLVLHTPALELPHPGLAFRRFVLEPAAEVAGQMTHPRIGWTIDRLLEHLNRAPEYAAIVGVDGGLKRAFASRLAKASGAKLLAGGLQHAASPPDSPVQSFEQGIKLLDDWRGMLACLASETSSVFDDAATFVSDFWWGEFPARVAELSADEQAALLAEWEAQTASIAAPKLLIAIAPAGEPADLRASPSTTEGSCKPQSLVAQTTQRLVSQILQTPGHGPLLHCVAGGSARDAEQWLDDWLDNDDWLHNCVRDAAAALEAMR